MRSLHEALQRKHAELQEEHSQLSLSSAKTMAAQRAEIELLSQQLSILQVELQDSKESAEASRHAVNELQTQVEDLSEIQDTSHISLVDDESWTVVREELHRQTDYLRQVEATNTRLTSENAILRQRNDNIEVLKERFIDIDSVAEDSCGMNSCHFASARMRSLIIGRSSPFGELASSAWYLVLQAARNSCDHL